MKGAEPKSWEAEFADHPPPPAHCAHSVLTAGVLLGLEWPGLGVGEQSKR